MPNTQQELETAISEAYSSLSKRLQQVARFVLDNPSQIAFGTVANISAAAGVHASTMVRFANAFGLSGFSDMQQLYKDQLLSGNSDYQARMQAVQTDSSVTPDSGVTSWFKLLTDRNIQAMQTLCDELNEAKLATAIDLLKNANVVHIQAVRRAFPVAAYLAYLLSNIGLKTHFLDGVGSMVKTQQSLITEQDVLFCISFAPYAPETQKMVEYSVEQGCKVIALTDSVVSPLCEVVDVCLVTKEAELHAFRSLNNSMNLVQAIVLDLINHSKQK